MLTPLPAAPATAAPATAAPVLPAPHGLVPPAGGTVFAAVPPAASPGLPQTTALPTPLAPGAALPALEASSAPAIASSGTPSPQQPASGPGQMLGGDAAAQASTATPMSLVAAQMTMGDTAPLQALLAQQAATRALPVPPRHSAPRLDAPPTPTDAAPGDSFDPHAPHLPQPSGAHPPHTNPVPAAKADDASEPRDTAGNPLRPLVEALPGARPDTADKRANPWIVAGAGLVAALAMVLLLAV